MNIINCLQNWLLIRYIDKIIIILKKILTKARQNLKYFCIFGSRISMYILLKNYSKSDIYKIWNGNFIRYTDTIKCLIV